MAVSVALRWHQIGQDDEIVNDSIMIRLSLAGCQVTTAVILIQETYVSNERSNSVLLECLFTEAEAEAGRNSVFNFLHSKPSRESRVWAARCYGCYD